MGKGKNQKKAGNKKKEETKQSHEVSIGPDASDIVEEESTQQQEQAPEEPQMSVEEKALKYKEMQLEIFNNFIKDFQEEERQLKEDYNFSEKQKEFDKREKEEFKKLEKIFKKEMSEAEDIFNDSNHNSKVKQGKEKISKTISETLKIQKQLQKIETATNDYEQRITKFKNDTQTTLNKKNLLNTLSTSLLDKNYELYLKHERMLDEEKQERSKLATNFQDQMKEVTVELEEQKTKRSAEFQENQELRAKIQNAINDYKKKEEAYRGSMDTHSKVIQDIEKKLKSAIEGSITQTLKSAEKEKEKFMKACSNVKDLSDKINGYMQKFDNIKEEMSSNGKKFENYQSDIETKKVQIQTLEIEIQNIQLNQQKSLKLQFDIEDEKKKLRQQIDTFSSLKNALVQQQKGLQDDKENKTVNT